MVDLPVYDLLLCALIIAKGMKGFRYGLETSLSATIIRHGIPDYASALNLLTAELKGLHIVLSRDRSYRDHNIGHLGARKRH